MSMTVKTIKSPAAFLDQMRHYIDGDGSRTWQHTGNDFSQRVGQLAGVGTLQATPTGTNEVVFRVKHQGGVTLGEYALLHTRFSEFILIHAADLIAGLSISPKPDRSEARIIGTAAVVLRGLGK